MTVIISHEACLHPVDANKELLKSTICKGATDGELDLFIHVCKHTGLDPFLKQIHPVKRWSSVERREVMSIQTSIDGFRLIAERTGNYCPGKESVFDYDDMGKIRSATAFVKKQTKDGTWHEIAATVYYDEYVQKTKDGAPAQFWARMPHVMLSKCAESVALRKSFPAELSAIYTKEEMSQADTEDRETRREDKAEVFAKAIEPPKEVISDAEWARLDLLEMELKELKGQRLIDQLCEHLKVLSLQAIEPKSYRAVIARMEKEVNRLTPGVVNERERMA